MTAPGSYAAFLAGRAGLEDKVAVLVGGAGGLGLAAARDLGRAGVRLVVGDRSPEALEELRRTIAADGAALLAREMDARDPDAVVDLVTAAREEFGGVDVLVNVVGGAVRRSFTDSEPRHWDAAIATNFVWVLHAVRAALPALRESTRGPSVITFTSIEAHRAAPNFAVYAAMKAALTSLTRSLAVELAPEGIRVNAVAADMVVTPGFERVVAEDPDRDIWADTANGRTAARIAVPMGRRGRAEDVGSTVLFLASELAGYLTGQTLHPDGGALASSGWFHWPEVGYRNAPPPDVVAGLAGGFVGTGRSGRDGGFPDGAR